MLYYRQEICFLYDRIRKKEDIGMKLGAQLYSVRTGLQTPEDVRGTFRKVKAIGYENVQFSGGAPIDAEILKDISEENGLPVVCTHSPFDRIVNDTDALIREHRIFDCPVIGLGAMPKEYRTGREGLKALLSVLELPVKKILDAGLRFAYHNHNFEFADHGDGNPPVLDQMLETCESWQFILDTYWVEYAGYSAVEYIRKVGGEHLPNIHFKDMAKDEKRSICSCGAGVLNFAAIEAVCREVGVKNVLVEQDNAVDDADPFAEMDASFRYLRPIVH